MNGGNSLVEPKFRYLLGKETVVLDTSSQLNAIIYPATWTLLQHTSLTSFLRPPVMAWFKTPHHFALRTNSHFTLCWNGFFCFCFPGERGPFYALQGHIHCE